MKNTELIIENRSFQLLTDDELSNIEGGFWPILLAVGGGAAAGLAIYEAGKATGEFIYWATH